MEKVKNMLTDRTIVERDNLSTIAIFYFFIFVLLYTLSIQLGD